MQTAANITAPWGGSLQGFYAPVRRCASALVIGSSNIVGWGGI